MSERSGTSASRAPATGTRRYYHRTSGESASAILAGGFRDGEGYYLTDSLHRGVWLSDRPLDGNEGAAGDVLLAIDAPAEQIEPFEWTEEGKPYREFLVPEDRLNAIATVTIVEGARRVGRTPRGGGRR